MRRIFKGEEGRVYTLTRGKSLRSTHNKFSKTTQLATLRINDHASGSENPSLYGLIKKSQSHAWAEITGTRRDSMHKH